jgi:hypothetical protein
MARTGHPNFILKYSGPWRGLVKQQSFASSLSGSSFSAESDALALLNGIWGVLSSFMPTGVESTVYVTGWAYYNGSTAMALWEKEYTSLSQATADGFTNTYGSALNPPSSVSAPPEACVRLQAPIGFSSSGKPVTMKKYIHWTGGTGTSPALATGANAIAANLGNGSLHNSIVLCSPKGAQGTWSAYQYFASHQMQRKHRKSASSSSLSAAEQALLRIIESAAGSGLAGALGSLIP